MTFGLVSRYEVFPLRCHHRRPPCCLLCCLLCYPMNSPLRGPAPLPAPLTAPLPAPLSLQGFGFNRFPLLLPPPPPSAPPPLIPLTSLSLTFLFLTFGETLYLETTPKVKCQSVVSRYSISPQHRGWADPPHNPRFFPNAAAIVSADVLVLIHSATSPPPAPPAPLPALLLAPLPAPGIRF